MSSALNKPLSQTLKSPKLDKLPADLKKIAQGLIDKKFPVKVEEPKKKKPTQPEQKTGWDRDRIRELRNDQDLYRQEYGIDYGYDDPRYRGYRYEYQVDFRDNSMRGFESVSRLANVERRLFRGDNEQTIFEEIKYFRNQLSQKWLVPSSDIDIRILHRRKL